MKKTHILLSTLLMMMAGTNANAQAWGTGVVNTWTPDNVGVGTTAIPTDASLRIDNYGGLTPPIPALKIDRYNPGVFWGVIPNQFEIWVHPPAPMCYPPSPCPTPPPVLVDVIDGNGWLGIQQAVPAAPIDVNGNGIIRNNLAVASNVSVGTVTPPVTPDASVTIHNSAYGSSPVPALKIDRYMPGVIFGPIPNHFEIWSHPAPPMCYPPSPCPAPPPVLLAEFDENGWLGINTPNPTEPLHVEGNARLSGTAWIGMANVTLDVNTGQNVNVGNNLFVHGGLISMSRPGDVGMNFITGNTERHHLGMYAKSSQTDGSNVEVFGSQHSSFPGQVHYNSYGNEGWGHVFQNIVVGESSPTWKHRMLIRNDGKVAIGHNIIATGSMPNDYLLYVEKGILTEKVKVALVGTGNWSDFVFNDDYNLMPLNKVEDYIKTNKHLPEIPSAEEVVKEGIDVATMDAKLLQKIEELTLYVIQQKKEIDDLRRTIEAKKN